MDENSQLNIFRETIEKCDSIWKQVTGESFLEKNMMFLPKFKELDRSSVPVNEPSVAQPSIFFYQVALFELYKSYGITPNAVIGHSAGELAAFYASGAVVGGRRVYAPARAGTTRPKIATKKPVFEGAVLEFRIFGAGISQNLGSAGGAKEQNTKT